MPNLKKSNMKLNLKISKKIIKINGATVEKR